MLGAIIGDIAGSIWEFNQMNDYNFEFFSDRNEFTDDTICTIAVADAILRGKSYGDSLREWCRKYPYPMGGYGCSFEQWIWSKNPKPYNSFGNGAAMRVSPVAWMFDDVETVMEEAEKTAACTHNHPEGIKGAVCIARAIFDCRKKGRCYLDNAVAMYGKEYVSNIKLENVQNVFEVSCQGTVPVALWIILNSNSFEDAVRRAVSLGADADTIGAIVGSIAEAIWPIPDEIRKRAINYLPEDMKDVVKDVVIIAANR